VSIADLLEGREGLRISDPRRTSIEVHAHLRELITSGALPPGTELKQAELARVFAVSRSPLRIYGIDGRREWIVVRSKQGEREVQLSLTKRFFLDEVWNALVTAGAIPRSDGPARRDRL